MIVAVANELEEEFEDLNSTYIGIRQMQTRLIKMQKVLTAYELLKVQFSRSRRKSSSSTLAEQRRCHGRKNGQSTLRKPIRFGMRPISSANRQSHGTTGKRMKHDSIMYIQVNNAMQSLLWR
jgi:hypothetical protein